MPDNNKLKMLRICSTYPRDIAPGMGQHAHYYSMYSDYDELIITLKRDGVLPKNREGVRLIEIEASEHKLGGYNDSKLKRLFAFIRKFSNVCDFRKKAKKYIKEFNPDIVHLFAPIHLPTAMYAKKKCGAKILMSLHGSDALRIGKVKAFKKLLTIPDAVVVVGENMVDMLPDIKLKRPIQCIGNGVDLSTFKNTHQNREKLFVHVANLRWQKGQQYLINGFAEFSKSHPDYKLSIIGSGEEHDKLADLCKELNIQDKVDFKGTLGREAIAEELNRARAFVLTSVTEGFPKVIIEAMATGTPVISSDVGNIKNVVGESGIIFPAEDSLAVCNAMVEIAETDNWDNFSALAEEKGLNYGWEKVVKLLDEIYLELLKR